MPEGLPGANALAGPTALGVELQTNELRRMAHRFPPFAVLAVAALLAGCSFAEETLWPSLTGDQAAPPGGTTTTTIAGTNALIGVSPVSAPGGTPGTPGFQTVSVMQAPSTGTAVGQKVQEVRGQLTQLQSGIQGRNTRLVTIRNGLQQSSQRYYGTIAAVTQRLQQGTTPGNPILTNQWNQAQAELEKLAQDTGQLSQLGNDVAADAGNASFILDTIRATYRVPGAIDEDHRQLRVLEDETNRTVVLIDRVLTEVNGDVQRQNAWLGGERANLSALALSVKGGELIGPSLASRAYAGPGANPAMASTSSAPVQSFAGDGRPPLVVIRFDRPDVPFQQALYNAVSATLERRPQASFDLVAVTAQRGDAGQGALNQSAARRNAERVFRSLTEMGLPSSRVNLSGASAPNAATNEVHLYVR